MNCKRTHGKTRTVVSRQVTADSGCGISAWVCGYESACTRTPRIRQTGSAGEGVERRGETGRQQGCGDSKRGGYGGQYGTAHGSETWTTVRAGRFAPAARPREAAASPHTALLAVATTHN